MSVIGGPIPGVAQATVDLIERTLYDPSTGFANARTIADRLRPQGITYNQVKAVLAAQASNQQLKPNRMRQKDYDTITCRVGKCYQIDLAEMKWYARYNNPNPNNTATASRDAARYVCCCIDVGSRYVHAVGMKNKQASECLRAIKECFTVMGVPETLTSDREGGFEGRQVQTYLRSNTVTWFPNGPDRGKSTTYLVERWVRTLREKLRAYMRSYNTRRYIDVLDKLVISYNTQRHGSIKVTPEQAFTGEKLPEDAVRRHDTSYLQVGDVVRLAKKLRLFQKGTEVKSWTKQTYTIVNRDSATGRGKYVSTPSIDKIGRRFVIQSNKDPSTFHEALHYNLQKVDMKTLRTFKPDKTGERVKGASYKKQRKEDAIESRRQADDILQENVLTKPRQRNPPKALGKAAPAAKKVTFQKSRQNKVNPKQPVKKQTSYKRGDHVSVYFPQEKRSYRGVVRAVNKRSLRVYYEEDNTESLVYYPYTMVKRLAR